MLLQNNLNHKITQNDNTLLGFVVWGRRRKKERKRERRRRREKEREGGQGVGVVGLLFLGSFSLPSDDSRILKSEISYITNPEKEIYVSI